MDDNPGHDTTHRAFLQAFLARQVMTFVDAQAVLSTILTARDPNRPMQPGDITRNDFDGYVQALNDAISPFDLEIRSTRHQQTHDEVHALVNTTSDAFTQMSTVQTADEIAFVRRVLDAMFERYNTMHAEIMAITATQALKLAKLPQEESRRDSGTGTSTAAALTQSQAESVLENMLSEGWFERSRAGFYSLTPRALMELREWLADTYNEPPAEDGEDDEEVQIKIRTCKACREIVTVGQRCPRRECLGRLHMHCAGRMFRAQNNQQICPECKTPWTDPLPVGEAAARGSSTSQRRRTTADEDD
ncbi:hypothetical protein AMS68_001204 [Peltaster fructicola]|uniref:Non-structural maintenance of chromosomes element 1 homolog n=1 Tax=Peltaster fructicola TaxID=286661 RepID=A0A6H0XLQ6_9PEZI|nr:hypothetical protein AMS68_001204 [Peltaster fructicola]